MIALVASVEPMLAMMDEDGSRPAIVNRSLVILFLLRCQAVGKAAQMALIT